MESAEYKELDARIKKAHLRAYGEFLAERVEKHTSAEISTLRSDMSARFDQVDQRFNQIERRFDRLEERLFKKPE